jgi:minor extracellular serine protease Vpr
MKWRRVVLFTVFCFAPASAADLTRYVVVLKDAPLAARGNRERIALAQLSLKAELRARHIEVAGETHVLLNALFVSAEAGQLAELRGLPGVQYVAREPRFHLNLDHAEQLIDVPAAWNLIAGGVSNAGAGVKIGIIDTGIQSTHAAFQDAGLTTPPNYPVCSVFQMPLLPLDCTQFTNSKVIVARSYVPTIAAGSGAIPAANSRPDDLSPRDRVGHGTAVAMAAAGVRNGGVADTITGVAPKAFLGSYKVFGSPGVNNFTGGQTVIDALSDAFSDGMDIAVLSLGSVALAGPDDAGPICGLANNGACDPWAAAVKNAVSAGMLVVVAAGNEGPQLATIDSPGTAPFALTVAATTNSHNWSNPLTVNGLGVFHSLLGGGPAPASQSRTLGDAAAVGDAEACNPLPAGSLGGTYALAQRGTCTFAAKVQNLQAAGAAGAIIINNTNDNSVIAPGGLGGVSTIPAALIGYDDGQAIRTYRESNAQATASLSPALQPFEVGTGNQVAPFSSRGPALGTGGLKPDVAAAGTDLYLPGQDYDPNGALYAPGGYLISQGTSFSTPQVAGIAALLKQTNALLTPLQMKSAIVNSATQDVTENGAPASVLAVGAGKANAAAALAANVTANPVSASFGIVQASRLPLNQAIQLTNIGKTVVNLSLSLTRRTAESLAKTAIDRPNLTLAPGQTNTVNLTLTGTLPNPGIYEGFLTVQGGAAPLQIPYLYVVGDGVPANIVPLLGDGDDGNVGQTTATGVIILQLTDHYGVPVPNAPVRFSVVAGGGSLRGQDLSTDIYGFAGAQVTLGANPGTNTFVATAGGLGTTFTATGRLQPAITANGVVNAATFTPGAAVAPGSYVAIFGSGLAETTQVESTPYLPVAIGNVSVSFDTAAQSAPGHLHFVTPGQVNVQAPWEMQGQSSAQMKVSVLNSSGSLYTVPLTTYAPGMFEIPAGNALYAAARDENFEVITPANPAKAGHYIQLYCNGLGPVTNQPASGDPSPVSPLAMTTVKPGVTIGGQNAEVLFSGLAPTAVGLYQLNVVVPGGVSGVVPVTITIGGVTGKASRIAVQ